MTGFWGNVFHFMGSAPSSFSPKLCSACEKSARQYEVGAEVELTMIFADVRDSTPLAESLGPSGFKEIINRFFKETSHVLIERNAMVNRLMGDQVIGLFVPRFVGKNHAGVALEAAMDLLRVTEVTGKVMNRGFPLARESIQARHTWVRLARRRELLKSRCWESRQPCVRVSPPRPRQGRF